MSKYYRDVRDYPKLEIKDLSASHTCFGNPGGALDSDMRDIPHVFCPECCAHAEIEKGVCQHCETPACTGGEPHDPDPNEGGACIECGYMPEKTEGRGVM